MTVDGGPAALNGSSVNFPYVSVTLCVPGTTQCQTIDHVQVDTGSYGFRIISSELSPSLSLPAQISNSKTVMQCVEFADGFVWGPIVTADVKVGGETAAAIPVQIMGGSSYPVPSDCVDNAFGPQEDTVEAFGANAILGIGSFAQDCGPACAGRVQPAGYYGCDSNGCVGIVMPLAQQVTNPVVAFATDNNGVVLQLPSISSNGAATASGSLIFGIGTQTNNAIGSSVNVLPADPNFGTISTTYQGQTYDNSYIDSGSNGLFFNDSTIPLCSSSSIAPGFFCPTSTLSLTATNQGVTGSASTVTFSIGHAVNLLTANPTFSAYNNLGAPAGTGADDTFDFGLPFFYGRTTFFAIENHNTPRGMGPYYAY